MLNFVTSLNEDGLRTYGLNMLNSVAENWEAKTMHLTCFYHDFDINIYNVPEVKHITYRNLNDIQDMLDYRETFKQHNGISNNTYDWRRDAIKWCHKVFAMTELAFEMAESAVSPGWLIWLDADTVTIKPFSEKNLSQYLNDRCSIVHLGRKDTDYSETSFLAFNLNRQNPIQLLADLRGAYISGEVLGYREWHDGFIFERLLNIYKAHGTNTHNLSPNATGLDAFGQSPLADFMVHYKGNKKNNIQSDGISPDVNGPKRYGQLLTLIKHYNPKSVIETGTWNGGRAIQMAEAAFLNQDEFTYTGFDLFEDASAETDELELNTKQHNSLENVTQRLETYKEKKAQEGKTFHFELIKGNTNVTLKNKKYSADVAYLDGGHSIETVKNDYENIEADVVIFNSFFSEDKEGKKPDERHCGTNTVVQEIINGIKDEQLKYRVKILPSSDGVLNGGYAHLAVILKNDESKDIPDEFRKVPIVITPKDCMPDDYIINNINENLKLVKDDNWIKTCGLTEDKLIIVSGGDVDYVDLKNTIDKFKKSGHNFKIACVKHAYPKLLDNKITPDYCVILDPRSIEGESTHGIIRKDLFKKINKDTLFLVASMTDPSVVKHLLAKKANIKLWHAYSEAIRDKNSTKELKTHPDLGLEENVTLITGGTCAAMRILGMFHVLGFRLYHLFGFDCSVKGVSKEQSEEVLDTGQRKYMQVEIHGEHFWTTGELLAMAQDCEKLFARQDIEMLIDFHSNGPSLAYEVFKSSLKATEPRYTEILC